MLLRHLLTTTLVVLRSGAASGATTVIDLLQDLHDDRKHWLSPAEQPRNKSTAPPADEAPCSPSAVRFEVSKAEQADGRLAAATIAATDDAFRRCGMVMLSGVYSPDLLDRLQQEQKRYFEEYLERQEQQQKQNTDGDATGEMRSDGRYEVKTVKPPFVSAEFLQNQFVLPLANRVLESDRLEVDTVSSVTSMPHTPAQSWHRDVGALYRSEDRDRELEIAKAGKQSYERKHEQYDRSTMYHRSLHDDYVPAPGAVVFVPLVDVPFASGPTELLLQSHLACPKSARVEIKLQDDRAPFDECPWATERFVATAKRGDCIIFDLRMLHRGGANIGDTKRPMVYLTYVQEWYVDAVNFNLKQTRAFDQLSPSMRKLVSRIDSQAYTEQLEDLLRTIVAVQHNSTSLASALAVALASATATGSASSSQVAGGGGGGGGGDDYIASLQSAYAWEGAWRGRRCLQGGEGCVVPLRNRVLLGAHENLGLQTIAELADYFLAGAIRAASVSGGGNEGALLVPRSQVHDRIRALGVGVRLGDDVTELMDRHTVLASSSSRSDAAVGAGNGGGGGKDSRPALVRVAHLLAELEVWPSDRPLD